MKQERSIKELLQLMLEHQDLFTHGLCMWIEELVWRNYITPKERDILDKYIQKNRPKNFYWFIGDSYYWEFDIIKPRIKWIKKHISRL